MFKSLYQTSRIVQRKPQFFFNHRQLYDFSKKYRPLNEEQQVGSTYSLKNKIHAKPVDVDFEKPIKLQQDEDQQNFLNENEEGQPSKLLFALFAVGNMVALYAFYLYMKGKFNKPQQGEDQDQQQPETLPHQSPILNYQHKNKSKSQEEQKISYTPEQQKERDEILMQIKKINTHISQNEDYKLGIELFNIIIKDSVFSYLVHKQIARMYFKLLEIEVQKQNLKQIPILDEQQAQKDENKEIVELNKIAQKLIENAELYFKSDQKDLEVHYMKAATLKYQGKIDEGAEQLEIAIRENPFNIQPILAKGLYYKEQQDYEKAGIYFQQAIQINPEQATGYVNLAYILKSMGKYQESIEQLQKAIKIDHRYSSLKLKFEKEFQILE